MDVRLIGSVCQGVVRLLDLFGHWNSDRALEAGLGSMGAWQAARVKKGRAQHCRNEFHCYNDGMARDGPVGEVAC